MNNPSRILIGTIAAFLIIAAGLAGGYYFKFKVPQSSEISASESPLSSIEDTTPNHQTYDISPPSRGASITKLPIEIQPSNDSAVVQLSATTAHSVKTGQKILLYNASGLLLEILGEVVAVASNDGDDDLLTITIKLNGDERFPSTDVARGEIVTEKISDAQRLPLTALVKDKSGPPHIWEVVTNQDGTSAAYYKQANVLASTYEFFVIEQQNYVSNVFILNPDDKLRDGQTINVRKIFFAGPTQTDDTRVAGLVDSRTPRNITDPYKGPRPPSTCGLAAAKPQNGNAATSCGQSASSGCGATGSPDALQDFIRKIRQAPVKSQVAPAS